MSSLYGVIADMRREHRGSADAAKTLDMVVEELGSTRDNLRQAVAKLEGKPLPPGGQQVLEELLERARAEGVDDLQRGPAPDEIPVGEDLDEADVGIAALLGVSSLLVVLLAAAAIVVGVTRHMGT
jgi:hypothetical protein